MSGNKTIATDASVQDFINSVEDPIKREECQKITAMMTEITGEKPVMWGSSIIGFGTYYYKYDSGREGDMLITGFSPRKNNFAFYVGAGSKVVKPLLKDLGKHSTGKSCLYIKRLSDVNLDVLSTIIAKSHKHYSKKYNQ